MKNIFRKSIIIFVIIELLIMSPVSTVFASDDGVLQEKLGSEVIRFARAFVETANQKESGNVDKCTVNLIAGPTQLIMYGRGNKNGWHLGENAEEGIIKHRETGYNYFLNGDLIYAYGDLTKDGGTNVYAYGATDKLCFDCSYFVSFIYSFSCGKLLGGSKGAATGWLVSHYKGHNDTCDCGFEYVGRYEDVQEDGLKPGDVIVYEGHVMLFESYAGNKEKRYANGFRKVNIIDCGYRGIKCAEMSPQHANGLKNKDGTVIRVSKETASELEGKTKMNISDIEWPGDSGMGFDLTENETVVDYTEDGYFYYNGMPRKIIVKGHESLFKKIIEFLNNILDWYLGLNVLAIKIQAVGWTGIIENNIIKSTIEKISGQPIER